ncbi:MFS transporter [Deinococcus radiotolerans]|uniref:MFS transporter n=1 Tax=Deinococcus radiotolerans TaxID=1309407 RepID=A0ABQ2FIU0_9DEIO|nr:MFS transporter [Deinococcus radiotolerans]GGK93031.1 MFS transporter [Deinococcus radiotolerans]
MTEQPTRLQLPAHAQAAPPPGALSVDGVIEQLGVGAFQVRLLLICGLTFAADAMEVLLMGFAAPGVNASFHLPPGALGATMLLSATYVGMLLGAPFWGRQADVYGRRPVFLFTVLAGVIFGLVGAMAPNIWVLVAARVLAGFAIGGTMAVDYALIAEFVPRRVRGRFLVLTEAFWAVGTLLIGAAAYLLGQLLPPQDGWRMLVLLAALPGVVGLLVRTGVPDSPRWLLSRGRVDDARQALARVALLNRRPLPPEPLQVPTRVPVRPPRWSALFSAHLRDRTLLLGITWFGMSLGYYGIFSWLPTYLRTQGVDLPEAYRVTMILALAQVPGYLLASLLIEWLGRRVTLTAFMLTSAAGAYLFLMASTPQWAVMASGLLAFALLGTWGALYAFTAEVFPTTLRATGLGTVSAAARLGSLVSPAAGALLLSGNLGQALTVFAASFIISAGCVWATGLDLRGQPIPEGEHG